MDKIHHYLEKWDLKDPLLIEETKTSHIYKVTQKSHPTILKILTPMGQKYESSSAKFLRCFDGQGAVRLIETDDKALLLEYIDGLQLVDKVREGKDSEAQMIVCDILEELHKYSGPLPKDTENLEFRFKSLTERAHLSKTDPLFIKTAKVAGNLIASEENKVLLHGDIHHFNILQSRQRGWLSIDPQPFYGERTFDLANTFFNPEGQTEVIESIDRIIGMAKLYSQRLKIDESRILKFAYAYGGLSSSWKLDQNEDPSERLRITLLIESLVNPKSAPCPSWGRGMLKTII